MSDISTKLHESIQRAGYSYGELAKLTGIPKSAIQRYATGATPKIPMDRLQLLANALNVSAQYLMGWEEKKDPLHQLAEKKVQEEHVLELVNGDPELTEFLEELRDNPDMRMLFSVTKGASKEDVQAAVRIILALRGDQMPSGD